MESPDSRTGGTSEQSSRSPLQSPRAVKSREPSLLVSSGFYTFKTDECPRHRCGSHRSSRHSTQQLPSTQPTLHAWTISGKGSGHSRSIRCLKGCCSEAHSDALILPNTAIVGVSGNRREMHSYSWLAAARALSTAAREWSGLSRLHRNRPDRNWRAWFVRTLKLTPEVRHPLIPRDLEPQTSPTRTLPRTSIRGDESKHREDRTPPALLDFRLFIYMTHRFD